VFDARHSDANLGCGQLKFFGALLEFIDSESSISCAWLRLARKSLIQTQPIIFDVAGPFFGALDASKLPVETLVLRDSW
jgi:hypothetical protein